MESESLPSGGQVSVWESTILVHRLTELRPMRFFEMSQMAGRRISQLLSAKKAKPLRMLRDLLELSQVDVASKLHVRQAAVSRLESREDPKLPSLVNVVRAMGGEVEVRVHFKGCELPIVVPAQKARTQKVRKPKETAHT